MGKIWHWSVILGIIHVIDNKMDDNNTMMGKCLTLLLLLATMLPAYAETQIEQNQQALYTDLLENSETTQADHPVMTAVNTTSMTHTTQSVKGPAISTNTNSSLIQNRAWFITGAIVVLFSLCVGFLLGRSSVARKNKHW